MGEEKEFPCHAMRAASLGSEYEHAEFGAEGGT